MGEHQVAITLFIIMGLIPLVYSIIYETQYEQECRANQRARKRRNYHSRKARNGVASTPNLPLHNYETTTPRKRREFL